MTDKILKAIEEFEALRAKATQGEWIAYEAQPNIFYVNTQDRLRILEIASFFRSGLAEAEDCAIFVKEAANRATHFTAALKVAVEALGKLNDDGWASSTCTKALAEIERLLEIKDDQR